MDQTGAQVDAPTAVIAANVKALRDDRGWSAERLAAEMSAVGIPWKRIVVTKLENGRRQSLNVAEWLALAAVFKVAPIHLLVPLDDEEPFEVTPGQTEPAGAARDWIRGAWPLDDSRDGLLKFYAYMPEHEFWTEKTSAREGPWEKVHWKQLSRVHLGPREHIGGWLGTYQDRKRREESGEGES